MSMMVVGNHDTPPAPGAGDRDVWPANLPSTARLRTNIRFGGEKGEPRQLGGKTRRRYTTKRRKFEDWGQRKLEAGERRMSTFTVSAAEVSLDDVAELVKTALPFRRFGAEVSIVRYREVLHCQFTGPGVLEEGDGEARHGGSDGGDPGARDVFIFPYGAVVTWGLSEDLERRFIEELTPTCEVAPSTSPATTTEAPAGRAGGGGGGAPLHCDAEFMAFTEEEGEGPQDAEAGHIGKDTVRVRSGDPMEKLAVSFAFAQSSKLTHFEGTLEDIIEQVRPIPDQLSRTGECKFGQRDVAILSGKVFLVRAETNLFSDILDTPGFFWDAEQYEPVYRRASRYLDVESRVGVLNARLDIVNDLLDNLTAQLTTRVSERLEVIIIALIVAEILIEVVDFHPAVARVGSAVREMLRRAVVRR